MRNFVAKSKFLSCFCIACLMHVALLLHITICSHDVVAEPSVIPLNIAIVPQISTIEAPKISEKLHDLGLQAKQKLLKGKQQSRAQKMNASANALPVIYTPKFLHYEVPKYPKSARRLKQQGTVIVDIKLGADGNKNPALIYQSSGHKTLDKAAVEAANLSSFDKLSDEISSEQYIARIKYEFLLRR